MINCNRKYPISLLSSVNTTHVCQLFPDFSVVLFCEMRWFFRCMTKRTASGTCSDGTEGIDGNGVVCCPLNCGLCGGSTCAAAGTAAGLGASACCGGGIKNSGVYCDDSKAAPCIIGSAPTPAPALAPVAGEPYQYSDRGSVDERASLELLASPRLQPSQFSPSVHLAEQTLRRAVTALKVSTAMASSAARPAVASVVGQGVM